MEIRLAENIRTFRKDRHLTQEALAEAMNVTPGAVYKWESSLSIPELPMIMELADFFDVSVDTLIGSQLKDNRIATLTKHISELAVAHDPAALSEAEKALKKYPYSFEIVHLCAQAYMLFSIGKNHTKELERAQELLESSLLLISQNTDPSVGELTIYGEMASLYILSGKEEKGIELMKKHNIEGVFSHMIGMYLSISQPQEAEKYLSSAFLNHISALFDVIPGYVITFCSRKEYQSAEDILQWGRTLLRGLHSSEEAGFIDKLEALLMILKAYVELQMGKEKEADDSVCEARRLMEHFDQAPDYTTGKIRFIADNDDRKGIHDSLGSSAAESIANLIGILNNQKLKELWQRRTENENS